MVTAASSGGLSGLSNHQQGFGNRNKNKLHKRPSSTRRPSAMALSPFFLLFCDLLKLAIECYYIVALQQLAGVVARKFESGLDNGT